ncbi:SGNH/GDSL hydrolase family protein [Aeromicrobium sp.]|uniref:SGNH/GDSL hydrolase family protein n=1 Tax=Aeromicrobium sp. TaxID=1871063 RepID=UPI0019891C04|nr:SGNH/GDSL hydrolase family protein [Aeromicrobium sp.]MBC7633542.1 SGNH/GDSL hydrolase family protein [Aeromicrobium sp.]
MFSVALAAVVALIAFSLLQKSDVPSPPEQAVRALVPLPVAAAPSQPAELDTVRLVRPNNAPMRVLFVGDSLTGAYFASVEENGFQSEVIRALTDSGGHVEAIGASRAGASLTTVASITDVPSGLHLAVVELGTNDVGARTSLINFRVQYAKLLERIRLTSPAAALVCLGVWQTSGSYDVIIEDECIRARGAYRGLRDLYTKTSLHAAAGSPTFQGPADGFHPNDAGHRAIADRVLKALTT